MLGADALANLGTLVFSRFEVGELAAVVVIVIALVPSSLWFALAVPSWWQVQGLELRAPGLL